MNCRAATDWLLAARPAEPLPCEVAAHLQGCAACAALSRQAAQVDRLARKLSPPVSNSRARVHLEERLDEFPRGISSPARTRGRALRRPWWYAVSAAAVLLALGWVLGRYASSSRDGGPAPTVARQKPAAPADEPLLVRVAWLASLLSGEDTDERRLGIVLKLTEELRDEAVRLAGRGDVDDLPRLSTLYDRAVLEGVALQARVKGDENRFAELLARSEKEFVSAEKKLPPAVGIHLDPFLASTREAASVLRGGARPATGVAKRTPTDPPLEGMVGLVLELAREEAPLPRAEISAELAEVVAKATVLLSVGGQPQFSERMGMYLDYVMEQGVAENLERAELLDRAGSQRQAIAKVRERAEQAPTVLEKNLDKAPPAAQEGLQRALDVFQQGNDRGKGKGKGPPWTRPNGNPKNRVPPGWQKKKD